MGSLNQVLSNVFIGQNGDLKTSAALYVQSLVSAVFKICNMYLTFSYYVKAVNILEPR